MAIDGGGRALSPLHFKFEIEGFHNETDFCRAESHFDCESAT